MGVLPMTPETGLIIFTHHNNNYILLYLKSKKMEHSMIKMDQSSVMIMMLCDGLSTCVLRNGEERSVPILLCIYIYTITASPLE